MRKYLTLFFVIAFFTVGFSVGMYLSIDNTELVVDQEKKVLEKSIQDVVIREVQKKDDNIIEAIGNNIKISPYAKFTIEKHFSRCGHTILDTVDIPKEIINLTEEELREKYSNWEIKSFEADNIHIYRKIDANCSAHFILKDKDGYVAVYNDITENMHELKETTYISVASMRTEDQERVKEGISIYGEDELSSFIEDFNS